MKQMPHRNFEELEEVGTISGLSVSRFRLLSADLLAKDLTLFALIELCCCIEVFTESRFSEFCKLKIISSLV
jgi:hypothetical protein